MSDGQTREPIRELVWEWDPLGDDDPTHPHLPRDEYDWLVRQIETELRTAPDAETVATAMADAVRRRYGMDDPPSADEIARRLVVLDVSR